MNKQLLFLLVISSCSLYAADQDLVNVVVAHFNLQQLINILHARSAPEKTINELNAIQ